ncbi:MAG: C40 family peptidase [Bacteroidales bacterium]
MHYALSVLPVVPLRSGPSEKDEMTSQVLFGELVIIMEKQQKWSFVEICHDGYQGWLYNPMVHHVNEETALQLLSSPPQILGSLLLSVSDVNGRQPFYIPAGSSLYGYKHASNSFHFNGFNFSCLQEPLFYQQEDIRENISQAVRTFINIPYLWGGKNPFGMDCSGLTQIVMKIFGRSIPRDSKQQVKAGSAVNFINEARPGDLAFFDNEEGEIIHTGIITGQQEIVHASGHVRTDRIDHQGIYNSALKQYTHKLRVIRNIID